jgi:hypothetical protein
MLFMLLSLPPTQACLPQHPVLEHSQPLNLTHQLMHFYIQ